MNEEKPKSKLYLELEQQPTIRAYYCEVCDTPFVSDNLLAIEGIKYLKCERMFPWFICLGCAEKISNAFRVKVGKNE